MLTGGEPELSRRAAGFRTPLVCLRILSGSQSETHVTDTVVPHSQEKDLGIESTYVARKLDPYMMIAVAGLL